MTDLALIWDNAIWGADVGVAGGDLIADDGLHTAVIMSLFLDAPAKPDDVVPEGAERRGFWGDALAEVPGDVTGSRLWLLRRAKQLASKLSDAQTYAAQALQWMVDDGVAKAVSVAATNPQMGVLNLAVAITRPDGSVAKYELLWNAS